MQSIETFTTFDDAIKAAIIYFTKEDEISEDAESGSMGCYVSRMDEEPQVTKRTATFVIPETGSVYVCFILKDTFNG